MSVCAGLRCLFRSRVQNDLGEARSNPDLRSRALLGSGNRFIGAACLADWSRIRLEPLLPGSFSRPGTGDTQFRRLVPKVFFPVTVRKGSYIWQCGSNSLSRCGFTSTAPLFHVKHNPAGPNPSGYQDTFPGRLITGEFIAAEVGHTAGSRPARDSRIKDVSVKTPLSDCPFLRNSHRASSGVHGDVGAESGSAKDDGNSREQSSGPNFGRLGARGPCYLRWDPGIHPGGSVRRARRQPSPVHIVLSIDRLRPDGSQLNPRQPCVGDEPRAKTARLNESSYVSVANGRSTDSRPASVSLPPRRGDTSISLARDTTTRPARVTVRTVHHLPCCTDAHVKNPPIGSRQR